MFNAYIFYNVHALSAGIHACISIIYNIQTTLHVCMCMCSYLVGLCGYFLTVQQKIQDDHPASFETKAAF